MIGNTFTHETKPLFITIPAQLGFYCIYEGDNDNKSAFIDYSPVLAWQIEHDQSGIYYVTPITISGAASSNYIGVMNPDQSITLSDIGTTYSSLDELNDSLKK